MLFRIITLMALITASAVTQAQGRIAVVDLDQAILQTDFAQQRLRDFQASEAFAEDLANFNRRKDEYDQLDQKLQRDQAAMSDDEKIAAQQKLASKRADLEYVAKKLGALEQQNMQRVRQELLPAARQALGEVIETDQIGLLLQAQAVIHADLGYNITAKITLKITEKLNQLPKE
jgi:outer membrane protein